MISRLAFFALLVIAFSSCETEVDLNAPYKSYTTVYGLLDLSADTQIVRINKSFLGAGSALDFAQVPDSSEYNAEDVEAYIEWGNNVVQLQPYVIPNRDPGVFYDENILVFITDEDLALTANGAPININTNPTQLVSEYRLVINVNGRQITGVTAPVYLQSSNVSDPSANSDNVGWVLGSGNFLPKKVTVASVPVGVRYEASIFFHFREHHTNGDVKDRSFEFKLGAQEMPLGSNGTQFNLSYNPETIFTFLANNLECGGSVSYRSLLPTEFVVHVAGEDLSRYMTINNPVTGIVTERPDFSNIEGENAIGLFSSRFRFSTSKILNGGTREELYTGDITGLLCFCNPEPGSVFPCTVFNNQPCPCN